MNPDQMHLTLRFIGDVNSSVFRDVLEALPGVRSEPFSIQLEGLGFFPPRGNPRVVWVGMKKNDALIRLRKKVESVLVNAGLDPEGRKYSPHITLARLKSTPSSKVAAFLSHNSMFVTEDFQVNEFLLYSSVLNGKGAKHYIEAGYPLSSL